MGNNKYNIPQGYKDSPLGVIPEDWEVKKLGDEFEIYGGGTPNTSINELWGGSIQWFTPTEIKSKYVNISERTITLNGLRDSSAKILPAGSLLFTSRATIGEVAFNRKECATNQGFQSFVKSTKNDMDYFYYWLINNKNCFLRRANGSTFLEITKKEIEKIPFPLPPLSEQKAIADILSTWDNAIEKYEALLEQYELRKKGLMQRLLSGEKRLKGFDGEWEEKKMSDIFYIVTRKNTEINTNVVTISAQKGFVKQTDFFKKTIASKTLDNYFLVKKDEFCYNKSYSNGYPWGAIKRLSDFNKAVVTTLYICFGIKNKNLTNVDFFEQYFEANLLDKNLTQIAYEGGRAHGLLNVTPSDFFSLKITIPSFNEQNRIANILQTADKEIALLKEKIERLRDQKKGLMQVLLTGRKRVKLNEQ